MGIKKITISREGLFFTDDACYELKCLFMETVMKRYFFLNEQNVRSLLFCYIPTFLTATHFSCLLFLTATNILLQSWKSVKIRPKSPWKSVKIDLKIHWKSVKI